MSLATARRDIQNRLNDNWGSLEIAWENVPFEPPADGFVEMRITEDNVRRLNIGTPGHHRVTGLIIMMIRVPKNTGTQVVREYADQIGAIFRDQEFNGILCREAVPTNIGERDGWYRYDVSVRYQWDGIYS